IVSVTMPNGFPPARSARPPERLVSQPDFRFDYEHESARSIAITDERGCGYAPFEAEFDGGGAGIIVGDAGTPMKGLRVDVFPATIDPQRQEFVGPSEETDAHGAYRISKLPPGRYLVGINIRDEPSEALPFPATFYPKPGGQEPFVIDL